MKAATRSARNADSGQNRLAEKQKPSNESTVDEPAQATATSNSIGERCLWNGNATQRPLSTATTSFHHHNLNRQYLWEHYARHVSEIISRSQPTQPHRFGAEGGPRLNNIQICAKNRHACDDCRCSNAIQHSDSRSSNVIRPEAEK